MVTCYNECILRVPCALGLPLHAHELAVICVLLNNSRPSFELIECVLLNNSRPTFELVLN